MNSIVKGFITNINIPDGSVEAQGEDGQIYPNVLLINPIGTHTAPQITNNTEILLLKSMNDSSVTMGVPYNYTQQFTKLPVAQQGDYAVGSLVGENKITFNASGDTDEVATNKNLNTKEKTSIKSDNGGEMSVDTLLTIKNNAENLLTLLTELLTLIINVKTLNPITSNFDLPIDPSTQGQLSALITRLNTLLSA
jgi:hypothetical protein